MDIARPDLKKKRRRRLLIWAGIAVVVLTVAVVAVSRLKPAAPSVDPQLFGQTPSSAET